MNKHGVLLDMLRDKLLFVPGRCEHDGNAVILTPDRVNKRGASVGDATFEKIVVANKTDAVCTEFRDAIAAAKETLHKVRLATCRIVDGVLFKQLFTRCYQ